MSDVILAIGGRSYSVACAAGEEAHVAQLGRIIDDKLGALPGKSGKNDSRSLLFAALLLADEVHELRALQQAQPDDSAADPARWDAIAQRLEALADAWEAPA